MQFRCSHIFWKGNQVTDAEGNRWALEVAEKMQIKKVAFWPMSATLFALEFCIPKLIQEGIIDDDGDTHC
ncbi:hypothetical protein RchiOBHm_Chr2g0165971 [Rosa chinensis]|uniref:Uncharacterized protein n=1 Tax=Rosa chinensis TaxID=74649 RepID=A0A2P6S3Z0_ROSCH|nr:hypothetical protein RchiOBHm_Chr2g0165971 [Rosa chinensis]